MNVLFFLRLTDRNQLNTREPSTADECSSIDKKDYSVSFSTNIFEERVRSLFSIDDAHCHCLCFQCFTGLKARPATGSTTSNYGHDVRNDENPKSKLIKCRLTVVIRSFIVEIHITSSTEHPYVALMKNRRR